MSAVARPAAPMSGVRASAVVFVGVGLTNVCNYGFHLLSARHLGPAPYGDVATLTTVSGIVTLPTAGAQAFVARHVASVAARGRALDDDGYVSGFGGAFAATGLVLTLLLLALSPQLRAALSIHSLTAVVLAVLVTAPSFLAPVLVGAIQGVQRFALVAAALALPSLLRLALAAVALAAGLGVPGALGATLAAALASLALPLVVLQGSLGSLRSWRPRLPRPDARALLPVVGGMLAITCLSSDDLVAAKAVFPAHEAGLYGSASLVGRVILYLPAAIITVLLPKVSARASAAHGTGGILARSLIATGAFCLLASAIYAAAPRLVIRVAFGSSYQGAAPLLWMFGVAMSAYALLNVLLAYRVGHGETRTAWLLLGGALVQAVAFAGLHSSPRELLTVSIATGGVLLVAVLWGPSERSPWSLRNYRRGRAALRAGMRLAADPVPFGRER